MDERDPSYWVSINPTRGGITPPQAPTRSGERTGQVLLLAMLLLFLVDTFLPWQRQCVDLNDFGFHIAGCLSANAWSGTAAHIGQAAGVLVIATIVVLGLRLGSVDLGEGGEVAVRVGVYGTAAAGGLKWILVIWRLAAFGAWIGLLLLLAIAILESVDRLGVG
jgi:hypothetical protein